MLETARLGGRCDAIQLDFVDRVFTPKPAMELGIQLHLSGLSLRNTVTILEKFGIDRCRSTVHNWVQKADLEPTGDRAPEKIALDETVIKIDGERFWFFAAVEPETNDFLHVGLYPQRTIVATKMFLRELQEKHDIEGAEFFVDGAPWLHAGLHELGMHFRHETHGDRNPVERSFQEIKRRTRQFYNSFSHANPETVENWLCALAWAQNNLI
jgi:transposase-like protein